jgi:hypothetical protein
LVIGLADKLLSPRLEELRVDLYFFCDHPVLLARDCTTQGRDRSPSPFLCKWISDVF